MISVEHLTKHYAGTTAVNDVSFDVAAGEIVGFLGPNGAGKSTTMRILAGYLPASGGRARVAGYDVTHESLEVRRRIGYLPESCPLYPDMRVKEYLRYRASLKGVSGRHRNKRVEAVMEQCDLIGVRRRMIGQLSKGFRQRVGIADALVHDPDLLILDEPTIGLDPNQIRQVRQLIRSLASKHTILLSTHILSEVEATCDRVMIINGGQIVESSTLETLQKKWRRSSKITAEIKGGELVAIEAGLRSIAGLATFACAPLENGWFSCVLEFDGKQDGGELVFAHVKEHGWALRELHQERQSLEDVFVNITKQECGAKA